MVAERQNGWRGIINAYHEMNFFDPKELSFLCPLLKLTDHFDLHANGVFFNAVFKSINTQ